MDWTHDNDGTPILLPTNKNNTISVIDSEGPKTYEISLIQNNEPFKYLVIISSTDDEYLVIISSTSDDQKQQFKTIISATKEGSRI